MSDRGKKLPNVLYTLVQGQRVLVIENDDVLSIPGHREDHRVEPFPVIQDPDEDASPPVRRVDFHLDLLAELPPRMIRQFLRVGHATDVSAAYARPRDR